MLLPKVTGPAGKKNSYRVADSLTQATALIQEGHRVGNAQWKSAGYSALNFLYTHAYLSEWDVFPDEMDNVFVNGSVNPDESFFVNPATGVVVGAEVKMGIVAQEAQMLLHAYRVTRDVQLRTMAAKRWMI